jgi:hypothetical protein
VGCGYFSTSNTSATIKGEDGKPILYASMHGEHLRFEFEYYARDDTERAFTHNNVVSGL